MQIEILLPRLQHPEKADLRRPEVSLLPEHVPYGFSARVEERLAEGLGSVSEDQPEGSRQGEGHHVVVDGQELGELAGHPFRGVASPADRTKAMVAAVPGEVQLSAIAGIAMPAHHVGATVENGLQGEALLDADLVAVTLEVSIVESIDNVGYAQARARLRRVTVASLAHFVWRRGGIWSSRWVA